MWPNDPYTFNGTLSSCSRTETTHMVIIASVVSRWHGIDLIWINNQWVQTLKVTYFRNDKKIQTTFYWTTFSTIAFFHGVDVMIITLALRLLFDLIWPGLFILCRFNPALFKWMAHVQCQPAYCNTWAAMIFNHVPYKWYLFWFVEEPCIS